jgi:hypothetical protein
MEDPEMNSQADDQDTPKQAPFSVEDACNATAARFGKTTFAQHTAGGATLVWVTTRERDPVRALMAAALDIVRRRGLPPPSCTKMRKLSVSRADGRDYYWQLTDSDGEVLAEGFEVSEEAANQALAKAFAEKKT